MENNKVFILLPDGVGLRNFAYTNFYDLGKQQGFNTIYWNSTPFDLATSGFQEIKIYKIKNHPFTDVLKTAETSIELNLFIKRYQDATYESYRFPLPTKTIKQKIKTFATQCAIRYYNSESKLKKLSATIHRLEKKTDYFKSCLQTLEKEKPAIVFCTNQRHTSVIAPIVAAKQLGIPTATFIFSWDNLPKATLILDTDYYFVWSDFMKIELQKYYPHITNNQILVTGTPQFENHFNNDFKIDKITFFDNYNLDFTKKYICYSGDDITTSPRDPQYLKDTAQAIRNLNTKGYNLGIIFRRCPVDFSTRFDAILQEFLGVIVAIEPEWKKIGEGWNTILPTKEDMILQTNTIAHTEFVVNLGSSMVFDYVCYNKPCVYVNYDVKSKVFPSWSVENIYKFIHFRSMPSKNAVVWLNNPSEIESKIEKLLQNSESTVAEAQKWFQIINAYPKNASEQIWHHIKKIIND